MSSARQFLPLAQAQPPFYCGVDLGGTNIKVGVVDDLGRPLSWLTIPTATDQGPEDAARRMGAAVKEAARQAGIEAQHLARVGLGTPGTMDIPAGMLLDPPNLPGWKMFPIRERVSHHTGLPVTYANDAGAAAYGEFWVGSGRNFHSMVMFTLGTGIGGGIIIGDFSVDGEHSHGSECGHVVIDYRDEARLCGCGQRGHLEAYASGLSVVRRTHEALAAGHKSSLAHRIDGGEELTPLMIAQEAEQGDPLALEIVLDTGMYLGIGIVTAMHTIDPDGVVLGGAMTFGGHASPLGRRFLERVREEVKKRTFPVLAQTTVVDFASLGGDAGFIGAAGLARLAHRQQVA
ncbi:MAG: ROK family protein [Pirellulales bacterium]